MHDDDFDTLAARADLARLLAACFYEPGPEFAEERLFDSMAQAAARIDPSLADQARRLGEAFAGEDPKELLVDYTRLFLGLTGALAQPYGSVWLEDRSSLMRDSTVAVNALYDEGGFELAEDFRDLPDHVAAELEFLYLLLFRRAEAVRNGDAGAARAHAELQRRFLAQHLGRWVPPFTGAIEEGAQTAFYRELAEATRSFVRFELGPRDAD
jgi:TorA maturation chaperone TorD